MKDSGLLGCASEQIYNKNNWQEADHLVIYKVQQRRVEPDTTDYKLLELYLILDVFSTIVLTGDTVNTSTCKSIEQIAYAYRQFFARGR